MILPKPSDALHKTWLYRLLTHIADDPFLAQNLMFKGDTAAAMRGFLDRFSVDLDFDLVSPSENEAVKRHLKKIFKKLDLEIKDESQVAPQFFLKYPNKENLRNTIKLDVSFPVPSSNDYEMIRLPEIDRIIGCQSKETIVANKMVALMDRYKKNGSIAGRDIYDIHSFLTQGMSYKKEVIEERTGLKTEDFLKDLKEFIGKKVTQTIIDQDLNVLLSPKAYQKIRKTLKAELLMLL